jgi:hypothetical protein
MSLVAKPRCAQTRKAIFFPAYKYVGLYVHCHFLQEVLSLATYQNGQCSRLHEA